MTDTWCCDTCRTLAEAANPLNTNADAGTDPICGKCGKPAEDGIFVVVCRHVLDDDFDEDEEGNRVPRIRVTAAPPSKPGPTYHLCDQASCTSNYALCAPCATNL